MSLVPNNQGDVVESSIWNTLIPFRPKSLDHIDESDDNENEEYDDDDDDDNDLSHVPIESEEADYMW